MTTLHLVIPRSTFLTLRTELRRRSGGTRESGAFLLTNANRSATGRIRIDRVAYYDDLDPGSLTGGITFHATGYTALAKLCRAEQLRVVADIHTHPAQWVQQSSIDAAHPMSGIPGHVAIICPDYAQTPFDLSDCGIHIYRGGRTWESHYGPRGSEHITVSTWAGMGDFLRRLFTRGARHDRVHRR